MPAELDTIFRPLAGQRFGTNIRVKPLLFLLVWVVAVISLCPPAAAITHKKEILDNLEAGIRAHKNGQYEQAIEYYTKVILDRDLKARDRAVTYLLRGEAKLDKGDNKKAEVDFARAVRIKPNYAQAHFFRGLAQERQGKLTEAYKSVKKALNFKPDNFRYQKKLIEIQHKLIARGEPVPQ